MSDRKPYRVEFCEPTKTSRAAGGDAFVAHTTMPSGAKYEMLMAPSLAGVADALQIVADEINRGEHGKGERASVDEAFTLGARQERKKILDEFTTVARRAISAGEPGMDAIGNQILLVIERLDLEDRKAWSNE
jgi:hypothetical protein